MAGMDADDKRPTIEEVAEHFGVTPDSMRRAMRRALDGPPMNKELTTGAAMVLRMWMTERLGLTQAQASAILAELIRRGWRQPPPR